MPQWWMEKFGPTACEAELGSAAGGGPSAEHVVDSTSLAASMALQLAITAYLDGLKPSLDVILHSLLWQTLYRLHCLQGHPHRVHGLKVSHL